MGFRPVVAHPPTAPEDLVPPPRPPPRPARRLPHRPPRRQLPRPPGPALPRPPRRPPPRPPVHAAPPAVPAAAPPASPPAAPPAVAPPPASAPVTHRGTCARRVRRQRGARAGAGRAAAGRRPRRRPHRRDGAARAGPPARARLAPAGPPQLVRHRTAEAVCRRATRPRAGRPRDPAGAGLLACRRAQPQGRGRQDDDDGGAGRAAGRRCAATGSSPSTPTPTAGRSAEKVPQPNPATVRDLLRDRDRIGRYSDVRAYTSLSPSRLEVLASDADPTASQAFSEQRLPRDRRRAGALLQLHPHRLRHGTAARRDERRPGPGRRPRAGHVGQPRRRPQRERDPRLAGGPRPGGAGGAVGDRRQLRAPAGRARRRRRRRRPLRPALPGRGARALRPAPGRRRLDQPGGDGHRRPGCAWLELAAAVGDGLP